MIALVGATKGSICESKVGLQKKWKKNLVPKTINSQNVPYRKWMLNKYLKKFKVGTAHETNNRKCNVTLKLKKLHLDVIAECKLADNQ